MRAMTKSQETLHNQILDVLCADRRSKPVEPDGMTSGDIATLLFPEIFEADLTRIRRALRSLHASCHIEVVCDGKPRRFTVSRLMAESE